MPRFIFRSFFVFILFAHACLAQSEGTGISRYFSEDVLPTLDPSVFVPLDFEWNFSGDIQAKMNAGLTALEENNSALAYDYFLAVHKALPDFFPASYYLGVSLKIQGRYHEAEQIFRRTISISRRCWQAHLQLAEVLHLQWKYSEAEKSYTQASNFNPTAPEPYFNLGYLEVSRGNHRKAFKLYEKATQVQSNFAKGYVMQGLLKMPSGIHDNEALSYFNRALDADSLCKEALFWRGLFFIFRNQGQEALRDWDLLVETNPLIMRFVVFRGFLNIDMRRFDDAFNDLRKAVLANEANEDKYTGGRTLLDKQIDIRLATEYVIRSSYGLQEPAQNFFRKGYCLFLVGKYTDAIAAFNTALESEKAAVIYFGKALAQQHAGSHAPALENYSKAIELDPEIFEARKKRAIYRAEQRNWKGAHEDLMAMEKLQPQSIVIHKLRGYTKMAFKNYYGAIVDLTSFIKSDSTESDVFLNRGICHDKVGNLKLAADDYLEALRNDSTNTSLYTVSGEQLIKSGDTLQSLRIALLRKRRFPKDPVSWIELANVQMLLKKTEEGQTSIDQALEKVAPKYFDKSELFVRAIHIKGMLYMQEKNYKAAVKQFSKVLEFSSKDPESQYLRGKCHLILRDYRSAEKDFLFLAEKDYRDSKEILASLPKR